MDRIGQHGRRCALATVLLSALSAGCSSAEDEEPPKDIYVYNPFRDLGHRPFFHGEDNDYGLGQMTDAGCEWYVYTSSGAPGGFRFYGSGWEGPQWGQLGMGSTANFNADGFLQNNEAVYLDTDLVRGSTDIATVRPFECDPTAAPSIQNPYGAGVVPSTARLHHLAQLFQIWHGQHYVEEGNLARVEFDVATQTVSEGIGYGMLIFAFVDGVVGLDMQAGTGNPGDWQGAFDRLWNYYQAFADDNGLMHWKINGFASAAEQGAASDADLDVAVALLVASAKWSDPTYQTAAQDLIARIRQFEMNASGYLMPGDNWDRAKNPSYFSFVAFELFRRFDTGYEQFWADAIARHYALLTAAGHPSTGLVPNWTNEAGQATDPQNNYGHDWSAFGYDAIRVPWRAAWAWQWFSHLPEHAPAYDVASRICGFITGATGGDVQSIRAEYAINGTPMGQNVVAGPGVVGAFASACMVDATHQTMLDVTYDWMKSQTAVYDLVYYQSTLQVLEALLLTGSMPNPWGL